VPYKGSGPAALDVLAGNVPLAVVDLPAALQQIKAGKLIAFAVTSPQRLPHAARRADGVRGRPARLRLHRLVRRGGAGRHARAIVARLNAEITAALNDEIKASMRNLGVEPAPSPPEAFEATSVRDAEVGQGDPTKANIKIDQCDAADRPPHDADVLVVGAGPVGLTLAMDLAARGVRW
jgi:hypothetical protein